MTNRDEDLVTRDKQTAKKAIETADFIKKVKAMRDKGMREKAMYIREELIKAQICSEQEANWYALDKLRKQSMEDIYNKAAKPAAGQGGRQMHEDPMSTALTHMNFQIDKRAMTMLMHELLNLYFFQTAIMVKALEKRVDLHKLKQESVDLASEIIEVMGVYRNLEEEINAGTAASAVPDQGKQALLGELAEKLVGLELKQAKLNLEIENVRVRSVIGLAALEVDEGNYRYLGANMVEQSKRGTTASSDELSSEDKSSMSQQAALQEQAQRAALVRRPTMS